MSPRDYIIGITGVMGSGKSEAAMALAKITGFGICNADTLAHETYRAGSEVWQQIVGIYGPQIVDAEGEIDRATLGAIVFSDIESLHHLCRIVHPPLLVRIRHEITAAKSAARGMILDAALLYELGLEDDCDQVWVIDAPREVLYKRLAKRSGISPAEAERRIAAQASADVKKGRADRVIINDGDLQKLVAQLTQAWKSIGE
jgi:dephospho-CoA kinase